MSTIRILLGIFCLIAIGFGIEPGSRVLRSFGLQVTGYRVECLKGCQLPVARDRAACLNNLQLNTQARNPQLVTHNKKNNEQRNDLGAFTNNQILLTNHQLPITNHAETRNTILNIARSQIGIREATGNNDGTQVEAYLKITNLPKGNPWCAAFVSWIFKQVGFEKPRTAWSPALFPTARQTLNPKPADVLGIYSLKLKRIAHAGLVERRQNDWIIAIEGNTNLDGGREGDGVYRKWRHMKTIKYFANWLEGGSR